MNQLNHTWLEISISAFNHNIQLYRTFLAPDIMLAAVVKSNAYGHGMLLITQLCENNPAINWFCVTNVPEALILRNLGIQKPILVMSAINNSIEQAIEHNIDLIVNDYATTANLNKHAAHLNKHVRVHLKVDTGLSRLGTSITDALDIVKKITVNCPYVLVNGIFSHFAESDNSDQTYTKQQLAHFVNLIKALDDAGIHIPYKHMGNSAAVLSLPESHCNFVRIGAGMYGLPPSQSIIDHLKTHYGTQLQPVMTWKTTIMHIKTIEANRPVGYSRTYKTEKETTVAILPVGYYEGYDRRLSNKGTVMIMSNNQECQAPVIGRICMNMLMVDISHIPSSKVGDEVILLGRSSKVQAYAIATCIESHNPREITTRINPLLPRILVA